MNWWCSVVRIHTHKHTGAYVICSPYAGKKSVHMARFLHWKVIFFDLNSSYVEWPELLWMELCWNILHASLVICFVRDYVYVFFYVSLGKNEFVVAVKMQSLPTLSLTMGLTRCPHFVCDSIYAGKFFVWNEHQTELLIYIRQLNPSKWWWKKFRCYVRSLLYRCDADWWINICIFSSP